MHKAIVAMSIVALAVASMAGQSWGGVLAGDPNGMAGWQGTVAFSGDYVSASLDYCVYDPAGAAMAWPTLLTNHAGDYLYMYQIVDVTAGPQPSWAYITQFSVGLDGDESVDIIGAFPSPGGSQVHPSNFEISTDKLTAKWYYNPRINAGQTSELMYFACPYGPETDQSTMSGFFPVATHNVPSPAVPEPATMALLCAGGLLAIRRRS